MNPAQGILDKLHYANAFVRRFKARAAQASAIPPLLELRERELKKATEQAAYWTQREAELRSGMEQMAHTRDEADKWLIENQKEYELLEATASAKVNKLANELAELLNQSEVGEGAADGNVDPRVHQ